MIKDDIDWGNDKVMTTILTGRVSEPKVIRVLMERTGAELWYERREDLHALSRLLERERRENEILRERLSATERDNDP